MFKVVTDQLKVSQGWVRCGLCAEIFDASLHLQAAQTTAVLTPVAADHVPLDQAALQAATAAEGASFQTSQAPQTCQSALSAPASEASQTAKDDPESLALVDDAPAAASELPSDVLEAADDVSFVRDARRQAFWRQPSMRMSLGVFSVLLTALLVLQVVIQQRDSLAALEPRLKPWLQTLCEHLECKLAPLRALEHVVIDSSSFNKINTDLYRLSFSIKNTGATPVAMPSLEVTLTDSQEQALIRRVLTPAQVGAASDMLGAGADFAGLVVIQVQGSGVTGTTSSAAATPISIAAGPLRIAGYRVLAFYP